MLFTSEFGVAPLAPGAPTLPGTGIFDPGGGIPTPPFPPGGLNFRDMARQEAQSARRSYQEAMQTGFAVGEWAVKSRGTEIANAAAAEAIAVAQQILPMAVAAEAAADSATRDPGVAQASYNKAKEQADGAKAKKARVDELYAIAKSDAEMAMSVYALRDEAAVAALHAVDQAVVAQNAAEAARGDALIAVTIRAETAATEATEAGVASEKAAIEAQNSANEAKTTPYTSVSTIQVASQTAVGLANTAEAQAVRAKSLAQIAAEEAGKGAPPTDLQKWYAKPWVWALIGGGTLLTGTGAYFAFRKG